MENVVDRRLGRFLPGALELVDWTAVPEHRQVAKVKWHRRKLLEGVLLGLISGRSGFAGMEKLSKVLSPAVRKVLGMGRRIPDTTLSEFVCGPQTTGLQNVLVEMGKRMHRRKSLEGLTRDLPIRMLSIDGKYDRAFVSIRDGETKETLLERVRRDFPYFQADEAMKGRRLYGEVRTSSVCLVGNGQATYLDCVPVRAETNEMGMFPEVLARIRANWGNTWQIELLSMDAGMTSLDNATLVDQANLGYLMAVKDNQPTLLTELHRLLGTASPNHKYTEQYRGKKITFRIWRTREIAGWNGWSHLRQGIRIQRETRDRNDQIEKTEDRYYVTNLLWKRLSSAQWAHQIRSHWLVENAAHRTLDVQLEEGDSPWTQHPNGMLAMALLRRVALNLLNLLRSLYLRSEESRATPWKQLMQAFNDLLRLATMDDLVRPRKQVNLAVA